MFMNKKVGLFLVTLLLSSFLISFVSAADGLVDLTKTAVDSSIDFIKPYVGILVNETDLSASNDVFMAKWIILLIVFSVVYLALKKSTTFFDEHGWVLWIISLAVPILGIRFLGADLIRTLLIPNAAFTAVVFAGLPFVLIYLITSTWVSPYGRRAAWILFAVIFLALYSTTPQGKFSYIYPLAGVLALAMAVFDGTLAKFRGAAAASKAESFAKLKSVAAWKKESAEVERLYNAQLTTYPAQHDPTAIAAGWTGSKAYRADLAFITAEIKKLS